jgi:hypothetical protein
MNPLAIPCLALLAVNWCVGSFYLLLFLRRRKAPEHLAFALLCFSLCLYDAFCIGLYDSQSLAQGLFWQRLQLVSLSPIAIATIWFVSLITGERRNRFLRLLTVVFCVFVPLALVPGLTLSASRPAVKTILWGARGPITYYEGEVGPVFLAGMVTACVAYAYLFYLLVRTYRQTRSRHLIAIMVGQVAYCVGVVNDGLVSSRVYSFVYVSEYMYLIVILTMAYAQLNRLVDLQLAVEQLNLRLEHAVDEARADLKVLHGLLPICAACKKIREDGGYWRQIEEYIAQHTDATFTHGMCPECARRYYPEVYCDGAEDKPAG